MNFISFFILLSLIFSGIQYILTPFTIFDFSLILLIEYATIEKNLNRGLLIVSLMGLIQDVAIGGIFGFNIFFKSLFFYIIFLLKEKLFLKNFFVKVILCWIIFIGEQFMKFYIYKFFSYKINYPIGNDLIIFLIFSPFIFFITEKLEKKYIDLNEIQE